MAKWVICYKKTKQNKTIFRVHGVKTFPAAQKIIIIITNFNKYYNFILNNIVLTRITTLSRRKST